MHKIYLAAPFGKENDEKRKTVMSAAKILENKGFEVYCPWKHHIPHAWDYTNQEWGLMVFTNDIGAIDASDLVVVLSYGRTSTAGTNWEAGYAFGSGKPVLVVEMLSNCNIMSLMVSNGSYARVSGLDGLQNYDFSVMPKTRTNTEQL